jgi:osomolarity two-component system sensor histidine kinase NIK1
VAELEKEMYDTDSSTSEESTPQADQKPTRNARNNMTISLDGLKSSIDPSQMFTRAYGNMKAHQATIAQVHAINGGGGSYNSAPPTALSQCPTCGKSTSDPLIFYNTLSSDDGPLSSSPLVVPMGPLAAAAFESGMSAVEELKLLKAQVQDVARVCNAVARGDLSQKITVPVQGVVMVQLKDVINTMVRSPDFLIFFNVDHPSQRSTNSDNSLKRLLVYLRKSEQKGEFSVSSSHTGTVSSSLAIDGIQINLRAPLRGISLASIF